MSAVAYSLDKLLHGQEVRESLGEYNRLTQERLEILIALQTCKSKEIYISYETLSK